jgi:hypothetical protein
MLDDRPFEANLQGKSGQAEFGAVVAPTNLRERPTGLNGHMRYLVTVKGPNSTH